MKYLIILTILLSSCTNPASFPFKIQSIKTITDNRCLYICETKGDYEGFYDSCGKYTVGDIVKTTK